MAWDNPIRPGVYERLTALGPVVDLWDGFVWRRMPWRKHEVVWSRVDECYVKCANQVLPWREAA